MRKAVILCVISISLTILYAVGASAGVLATDPAALPAWQGTQLFQQTVFTLNLKANVDFAVYSPGAFSGSAALGNPADPSGGNDYVYAYQVLNDQGGNVSVTQLSVGFLDLPPNGDGVDDAEVPQNIGFVDGFASPDVDPSSSFNPNNNPNVLKQAADWALAGLDPSTSDTSDVLFFTSPYGPEWDNGSILGGGLGATNALPSPVPEPATFVLGLLAVCLAAVGWAKRRRPAG